ncbi:hypothetical protein B0J18DRAFT_427259 [Chaetomium sp. MPI-SDFR-AT-0129]|nr:hypothetical protein B0J18DRAFT_427259 [Chaetomium sp. MPI-SDFR-AT-0129]
MSPTIRRVIGCECFPTPENPDDWCWWCKNTITGPGEEISPLLYMPIDIPPEYQEPDSPVRDHTAQDSISDPATGHPVAGFVSHTDAATGHGFYPGAPMDSASHTAAAMGYAQYPAASMGSSSHAGPAPVADMGYAQDPTAFMGSGSHSGPAPSMQDVWNLRPARETQLAASSHTGPAPMASMSENPQAMWYSGYPADGT